MTIVITIFTFCHLPAFTHTGQDFLYLECVLHLIFSITGSTVEVSTGISGSGTSFSNATSTVVRIKQGNEQIEVVSINSVLAEEVNVNIRVSNLKPLGSILLKCMTPI